MSDDHDFDDLDDFLDEFDQEIPSKPSLIAEPKNKPSGLNSKVTNDLKDSNNIKTSTDASNTKEPIPDHDSTLNFIENQFNDFKLDDFLQEIGSNPETVAQFEVLLKELNKATSSEPVSTFKNNINNTDSKPTFKDAISKTAERLNHSNQELENADGEDLLKDFMGKLDESGGFEGNINEMLSGIMQQLASKDILYQPIKDISDSFPKWWKEHESGLSEKDMKRYKEQNQIVDAIVALFESDNYSDQNKSDRESITKLMDQMQETGAPPPEIMSFVADGSIPGLSQDKSTNISKNLPECPQQ